MNEVLRQVFTCTAIGLNLMESETNLDDLTGKRGVKQRCSLSEITVDSFIFARAKFRGLCGIYSFELVGMLFRGCVSFQFQSEN